MFPEELMTEEELNRLEEYFGLKSLNSFNVQREVSIPDIEENAEIFDIESGTKIFEIYQDLHLFEGPLNYHGILSGLNFLKDLKNSLGRFDEGLIDRIILNGDIIGHMENENTFDARKYMEFLTSGTGDLEVLGKLEKKHGKIKEKYLDEFNQLITEINLNYQNGESLDAVTSETYNIDFTSQILNKVVQEIKTGMTPKESMDETEEEDETRKLIYIMGNHENQEEIRKLFGFDEEYQLDENYSEGEFFFQHGDQYDQRIITFLNNILKRAMEDEPTTYLGKFKKGSVTAIAKVGTYIQKTVERWNYSGSPLVKKMTDPFVWTPTTYYEPMSEEDKDKGIVRVFGHTHNTAEYYDFVNDILEGYSEPREITKGTIVLGTYEHDGGTLMIGEGGPNGEFLKPVYQNNTSNTIVPELLLSERALNAHNAFNQLSPVNKTKIMEDVELIAPEIQYANA